ncbi:MAG: hypothetical protein IKN79_08475 [Eubacterium sp.]|nr:hypothetical protein [Eubacterium sp.]
MARSLGGGGGSHSSGGGRSFGGSSFGGSRSFGGSHLGSSSTRRVSSGSSRSSSRNYRSHSSFHIGGGMPPPPPRYRNNYYRGGTSWGTRHGSGGAGCGSAFLVVFIIVLVLAFFGAFARYNNRNTDNYGTYETSGTSNRGWGCEKYTGEVDSSKGYWADESTDGDKWIDSTNRKYLEDGFSTFYEKTGVFPFLYVVNTYGDSGDYATYEEKVYDDLFGDCPGNLLFVFISTEESYYIAAGVGTGSVVNEKTVPNVIQSKISAAWSNSRNDGDLAKIFGGALSGAASLLMKEVETTILAKNHFKVIMIVLIVAIAVIAIILLLMYWWKKKKEKQKEEDERLEKILSQPLSTYASTELHQLGQQYMNHSTGTPGNAAAAGDPNNAGGNPPQNV